MTDSNQELDALKPTLVTKEESIILRLVSRVRARLAEVHTALNSALLHAEPLLGKVPYETGGGKFKYHLKILEVSKALDVLEQRLLSNMASRELRKVKSVQNADVKALPGYIMTQEEVDYPEIDFKAVFRAWMRRQVESEDGWSMKGGHLDDSNTMSFPFPNHSSPKI